MALLVALLVALPVALQPVRASASPPQRAQRYTRNFANN